MQAADPRPAPIAALIRALPELPPRLREAGRYLTGREFDAVTRSMRDLALEAGVNPTTFTRLARALGYAGWDELRVALVEARRPKPHAPFSGRVGDLDAAGSCLDVAEMAKAALRADCAALAKIEAGPIRAAAEMLNVAPRAWIAGFRSCRHVAGLLCYQLRMFRPDTVGLVGGSGPEDLDFGAFAPGHVLVIVGFDPYSRAGVLTARAARSAGCRVVAIVDAPDAPMAEGADQLLLFETAGNPGFFPGMTGAFAQVQALAAATFALGGSAALEDLRRTEARLAVHSQYVPGARGRRT